MIYGDDVVNVEPETRSFPGLFLSDLTDRTLIIISFERMLSWSFSTAAGAVCRSNPIFVSPTLEGTVFRIERSTTVEPFPRPGQVISTCRFRNSFAHAFEQNCPSRTEGY